MSNHLNQVLHNKSFIEHQCAHFNNSYFDWKVISAFYVAYHAIKALAESKKINIGERHELISRNINPTLNGSMPISKNCWTNYRDLRVDSESARYNGFSNIDDHESDNHKNFILGIERMNHVIKYCKGKKVDIDIVARSKSTDLVTSPLV